MANDSPHLLGVVNGKKAPIGTWWWNLHGIFESACGLSPDEAMQMLIKNNVSEIYLDVSGMYSDGELDGDPKAASFDAVRRFIKTCRKHQILVSALTGASRDYVKKWIDPELGYPQVKGFFDKIEFYNATSEPDERFSGIHIDVEPHSISDFNQNRKEYFDNYAKMMDYASKRAHTSGLTMETDVCGALTDDDIVTINGKEVKLLDSLFSSCDTVVVMAYRHKAERQMEFGTSRYIPYAQKYGSRLMVGCETLPPCDDLTIDDIPPSITYYTVGREKMVEEITKLQNLLQETGTPGLGVAVHHVHSWHRLPNF